ncbi:transcription termination/antitermination protein NusG [Coraliomargarita akajimensis]|uniref:Transcription termination/antitermination protein NusG n=1 Tax=Coraliomargarita akajimensis (strain DSM 45221 / IAM 15411 / JCM 23193 / KCTC 12865 / 04OKA010-24) TaxID=583355 RepID=D5EPY7_CORAD|nr:transcription termination/antitermination protein NusG [Coraliomargarita akajimensis]ADE55720.1 NusG antitermination factor [Coraliomargarita akajimensis DSM 45221]
MSNSSSVTGPQWYAVHTLSNQEQKAKRYLDKFIPVEEMEDYVFEILMPTETVTEVKSGKKKTITRKFYPGYVFVKMRLYDDDGNLLQKPWYFVREAQGVINFVGGDRPSPLKKAEIDRILQQVEDADGKEKPKIEYELGEMVKVNDGPFMNLVGKIEEIDPEKGKLKVSVSIFGRYTPVELEYWQVQRTEES